MVLLIFARASYLNEVSFNHYLRELPLEMQKTTMSFLREEDRINYLFGRLLLKRGLNYFDANKSLTSVKYSSGGRPYVDGKIDFNISHSRGMIVCGIGEEIKLGIDIEKIEKTNVFEFKKFLTSKEFSHIQSAPNSLLAFYRIWTMKEATFKYDIETNISTLSQIDTFEKNDEGMFAMQLLVDKDYVLCLLTNIRLEKLRIVTMSIGNIE